MRVRAFTQDDAHHFCTEDQLQDEIGHLIDFIAEIYKVFGFTAYDIAVSTRPLKAMGSVEVWNRATDALKKALEVRTIPFTVNEGEGAFYGPKIEFVIYDSLGRSWQCGTIQVDFSMPERFDLEYVANDSSRKRPVMVHRAIYGSIERFLGILIEHYGGAFPLWLAPVQVRVMTISERQIDAAREMIRELKKEGFRVEEDFTSEKIGYKIREAEMQKIPYVFVIGDREMESGKPAVRKRGKQDLGAQDLKEFIALLKNEIAEKK
jgi:threonyl-tRNA synthetase